jgi:hypothetical protein
MNVLCGVFGVFVFPLCMQMLGKSLCALQGALQTGHEELKELPVLNSLAVEPLIQVDGTGQARAALDEGTF